MSGQSGKLKIISQYLESNPADVAHFLLKQSPQDIAELCETFPTALLAPALSQLPISQNQEFFHELSDATCADVLSHFRPNFASAILRGLSEPRVTSILGSLSDQNLLNHITTINRFPAGTIGSIMNPSPFTAKKDMTISEVKKLIREKPSRYGRYVFIVGPHHELEGVITFRDIFYGADPELLSQYLNSKVVTLSPETRIESAIENKAWQKHPLLPVVDKFQTLIGALRIETLEEHLDTGDYDLEDTLISETGSALGEVFRIGISATASAFGVDDAGKGKE